MYFVEVHAMKAQLADWLVVGGSKLNQSSDCDI